jgi:NodT family efflux transporter outer membrane factor (OMF) lipoprotein
MSRIIRIGFNESLIDGVNMQGRARGRVYQTGSAACVAACVLALAGCKVGPDYERPELASVPESFRAVEDPSLQPVPGDHRTWWIVFDDPTLNSLIERAAAHNLDLRLAISRVNEARARTRIAQSERAPQLSLGGGYGGISNAATGFETRSNATLGIEASWEIDVFGRIARQVEAADAIFQATEEDRRDVQVSLFAEVARAYLSVRSLQAQLDAASRNIDSQQEILGLTRIRLRDGIASALEVAQASELLATSEAAVPSLRIDLSREINTIALLVGTHPEGVHAELSEPRPVPVPEVEVAVGVPADLIRQRPDIRAAERRLAAQSAQVGVATAQLYPAFSFGGSLSLNAIDGANLFDASSRAFSFGPSIRWNIFDGGRVRAQLDVENARLEQSVLLYEQSVLASIEQVESALTGFTEQRIRMDAVERAADAAAETVRLATVLFRDDLIDFQTVLTAQQRKLDADALVARVRGQAAQSLVQLYRALGGGWDTDEAAEQTQRPAAPASDTPA